MAKNDLKYINEDIEDVYDAAQYLQKIDNRNRILVKWTKFGKKVTIIKGR